MICIEDAKKQSSVYAKACTKSKAEMLEVDDILNDIWYANHHIGSTEHPKDIAYNFSVYDHPKYINNLDVCFKYYTRINLITSLKFFKDLNIMPKTILDLYGGDGRSSVVLAKAFPNSTIYYHQTAPAQVERAKVLFGLLGQIGINNIQHVETPVPVDAVFAFECFEHFIEPHVLFDQLGDMKYLVENSSFSVKAPGHFYRYVGFDDKVYANRQIKKNFYTYLRSKNMFAVHRKEHFVYKNFFNCTPMIHMRHV